jgi:hypothetical protein
MSNDIQTYNDSLTPSDKAICDLLRKEIDKELTDATSKLWHGHPVWFLDDNPIVGYAKRKHDVQLLFWSGQSFGEPELEVEGTFKAAQKRFTSSDEINSDDLNRWLKKAREIQWDYKNIVKRRGELIRLK